MHVQNLMVFVQLVETMRLAQQVYARARTASNLKVAQLAEAVVDRWLREAQQRADADLEDSSLDLPF